MPITNLYSTNIATSDYFTVSGLQKRTSTTKDKWWLVILKELIDNALDATERTEGADKRVFISHTETSVGIFDNGDGLSTADIELIFNFQNYASHNTHIITPSRGKQGNGLKCIIGICHALDYKLLWHTRDGVILHAQIDASRVSSGTLDISYINVGRTDKRGVEISGISIGPGKICEIVSRYHKCNPDTNFEIDYGYSVTQYKAAIDPQFFPRESSLAFYSFEDFKRLLSSQSPEISYKDFLRKTFGERVARASAIKSQIGLLSVGSEVHEDFLALKDTLNTKPITLLKKYLIGFERSFEASIHPFTEDGDLSPFPCLIEYAVNDLVDRTENPRIDCFINKSIVYDGGNSLTFEYGKYGINAKGEWAGDLDRLLSSQKGYSFIIHIIAPQLHFINSGKTQVDISDIITTLVNSLKTEILRKKRIYSSSGDSKPTKKALAEKYMDQAFEIASSSGKYSITARQMYYKLRELAGRDDPNWETKSTYAEFTQNWLTSWLDDHDEWENKVNFSERGNFYIDGTQIGLGSAPVRNFVDREDHRDNKFTIYGATQDNVYVDSSNFDIKYKYAKALYVEKTGFDAVFRAENLAEKYDLVIISGQGFASRSAKKLLHYLSEKGITLYCMHDLDPSGVDIYAALCQANQKFKLDLNINNLGILPIDVRSFGIIPEKMNYVVESTFEKYDYEHQAFFKSFQRKTNHCPRVELNAFTTEQILSLIDRKLSVQASPLPTIRLSDSLTLNKESLREVAFMRVMRNRYGKDLESVSVPLDLADYSSECTLAEARQMIPAIQEEIIRRYEQEITKSISQAER